MNNNTLFSESYLDQHSLWDDHPATPAQQKRHGKKTQRDVLASMLREARSRGGALELPDILRAGVAQHGARITELRRRGFQIENELERRTDGRVWSRYRLRYDPETDGRS